MCDFPNAVDVVVVGAGICGATCAASLAARGATVLVVEKEGTVAGEQSGRAQGAIRVHGREPKMSRVVPEESSDIHRPGQVMKPRRLERLQVVPRDARKDR